MIPRYLAAVGMVFASFTGDTYGSCATCLHAIHGEYWAGLRPALDQPPATDPVELHWYVDFDRHTSDCLAAEYPTVTEIGQHVTEWTFSKATMGVGLPLGLEDTGEWVHLDGIDVVVDGTKDEITMMSQLEDSNHASGLPVGTAFVLEFGFPSDRLSEPGVETFFAAPWNDQLIWTRLSVTETPGEDPVFASELTSVRASLLGDYSGNGRLDADDMNILSMDIAAGQVLVDEDLNDDGMGNQDDRRIWVHQLACTYYGDANVDGEFNSSDLVQVFEAGRYEMRLGAGWDEGDFNGDLLFDSGDLVFAFADGGYVIGPRLLGDYNRNGLLDAGDLDLQAIEMVGERHPQAFDLNADGLVNFEDRLIWVNELKNTWIGDANLDLEFNTSDIVQIFAGGKYETGQTASWGEGDFTGVMKFDGQDFVAIFSHGPDMPPIRPAKPIIVPEPGAVALLPIALLFTLSTARRRH